MEDYNNWRGKTLFDAAGNKVGAIGEIYVDERGGRPAWATVKTGLFGTKDNFFPIKSAKVKDNDEDIYVDIPEDTIKNAPKIDADEVLNDEEERALYEYYQEAWGDDDDSDTRGNAQSDEADTADDGAAGGGAVGHDTSGPTTDNAMTRSEEEISVGTKRQEMGRVRLKKYVVTDHVTTTVPVEREEVRIEREDITDDNRGAATNGPELSDEEHEVVLNEEVPVIDKKVVPKERIRLDKETVRGEERVESDVRKEEIDVAGDGNESKR